MFSKEPWHFYLGRLLEISPFYIFSFLSLLLFLFDKNHSKEYALLFIAAIVIILFYILWGNYQSRYILFSVVPLAILSAKMQIYIFEKVKGLPAGFIRLSTGISYALIILTAFLKTIFINIALAIPNQTCYF